MEDSPIDWSIQEFSSGPPTTGEMLDIVEAADPNVGAWDTLKAMVRFVVSRSRGPHQINAQTIRAIPYMEMRRMYQRAVASGRDLQARSEEPDPLQPFRDALAETPDE